MKQTNFDEQRHQQWVMRMKEADKREMSLAERLEALEQRERALEANAKRQAEVDAPATAEELNELECKRVTAHLSAAGIDLGDLALTSDDAFKTALRTCPKEGWPSGTDASHLRELRKTRATQDNAEPVIDPATPGPLTALLGL